MKNSVISEKKVPVPETLSTYLTMLCNIFNSDACALYDMVDDMHNEEKREEFIKRFGFKFEKDKKEYKSKEIDKYRILKFIGVGEKEDSNQWNLNYSDRPDKYVIFCDTDENPIEKEGLTGYSARIKKVRYYDEYSINKEGIRNFQHDDASREIHPPCKKCLVVPIDIYSSYSGGTDRLKTVVLRFDIYDNKESSEFDENIINDFLNENGDLRKHSKIKKTQTYNFLKKSIQSVLNQLGKKSKNLTYTSIYKGSKLVDALTTNEIRSNIQKDKKSLNSKYYEKICHLFYVLNRHTYIGQDEITNRVILFADELLKLSFNEDFRFKEILRSFRKHETLMLYDSNDYRDHFMHQMHVFILGYLVINSIGFKDFEDILKESYKDRNKREEDKQSIEEAPLDKDSILRTWFLTAFFHDISYVLEKMTKGISSFINDMFRLEKSSPDAFTMDKINWDQFLNNSPDMSNLLRDVCNHFSLLEQRKRDSTTQMELLSLYYRKLVECQDHAVFSALYLLKNFPNKDVSRLRSFEMNKAALAISLHNTIFEDITTESKKQIHFQDHPLAVLLLLCDHAQEWGRLKTLKEATNILSFERFNFESYIWDKNEKKIIVTIKYNGPKSEFIAKKLEEFLLPSQSKIVLKTFEFVIKYTFEDGSSPLSFEYR